MQITLNYINKELPAGTYKRLKLVSGLRCRAFDYMFILCNNLSTKCRYFEIFEMV